MVTMSITKLRVVMLIIFFQLELCCVLKVDAKTTSKRHKTALDPCHGEYLPLHFKTNVPMELCCTTDLPPCDKDDSLLTIDSPEIGLGVNWTLITLNRSSSTVKLIIQSPQESDSGNYVCYCNGTQISNGLASVIGEIDCPIILAVSSSMSGDVYIKFNPGKRDSKYSSSYTVSLQSGSQKQELCKNESIHCKESSCVCEGQLTPSLFHASYYNNAITTITVIKNVLGVENVTSGYFNLPKLVKPNPADMFPVEGIDSTSATLVMCAPNRALTGGIFNEMEMNGNPFGVFISVTKTQGASEERKFEIMFDKLFMLCLRIPLTQLTPYTEYNASVTLFGGGGHSTPRHVTFTTHSAAPRSPPMDIVYWIDEDRSPAIDSNASSQGKVCYISWKPIPHDEKGGNISYEVSVSYENMMFNHSVTESYIVLKIPDTPVDVIIHSKNEIGLSKNFSHLFIKRNAAYKDIELLKSRVEISSSDAIVSIEEPPQNVKISAIYMCLGNQNPQLPMQILCKGYPKMAFDGANFQHGYRVLNASFSLKEKECHIKSILKHKQTSFNFFKELEDDHTSVPGEVNFTVTNAFIDENDGCSSSTPHSDEPAASAEQPRLQHKFLFSVDESPRLFPLKCYYDDALDDIKLHFNQSQDEGSISLSWRQFCENSPQQFLAKKYAAFMSKDESCSDASEHVPTVENDLVKYPAMTLQPTMSFVCVVGFKLSDGKLLPSKAKTWQLQGIVPEKDGGSDGTPIPAVLASISGTLLVIVILLISTPFYLRYRKAKVTWEKFIAAVKNEPHYTLQSKDDSYNNDLEVGICFSNDYEQVEDSSCNSTLLASISCSTSIKLNKGTDSGTGFRRSSEDSKAGKVFFVEKTLGTLSNDSESKIESGLDSGSTPDNSLGDSSDNDYSSNDYDDSDEVGSAHDFSENVLSLEERVELQLREQQFIVG